jgi:1-acylglycerone phosphate reductase
MQRDVAQGLIRPTPWNGIYCSTKAAAYSLSEVMNMECRPFGISVMHVAPGAVRSNISNNAAALYTLPPDSLYKAYLPNIMKRLYVSQEPGSMPTKKFAEEVVSKALRASPPSYVLTGGFATSFWILKWLPRGLVLNLMWWIMGTLRT